jgi:hypothetical protein
LQSGNFDNTLPGLAGWRLSETEFVMFNGSISLGTDTTGFFANDSGQIWTGGGDWASADWRVDVDGRMRVGGDDTDLHIDASGNIWSGHNVRTSAPWNIDNTGKATFKNIEINAASATDGTQVINVNNQFIVTKSGASTTDIDLAGTLDVTGDINILSGGDLTMIAGGDIIMQGGTFSMQGGTFVTTGGLIKSDNYDDVAGVGFQIDGGTGDVVFFDAEVRGTLDTSAGGTQSGVLISGSSISLYGASGVLQGAITTGSSPARIGINNVGNGGQIWIQDTDDVYLYSNASINLDGADGVFISAGFNDVVLDKTYINTGGGKSLVVAPGTAVSLSDLSGSAQIGDNGSTNMAFGINTLQVRTGGIPGLAGTLALQPLGGGVAIGGTDTIKGFSRITRTVNPGTVNNGSGTTVDLTVTGAAVGDLVFVESGNDYAALVWVAECFVVSANTVRLRLRATTAGVAVASKTYTLWWIDLT